MGMYTLYGTIVANCHLPVLSQLNHKNQYYSINIIEKFCLIFGWTYSYSHLNFKTRRNQPFKQNNDKLES